MIPPTVSSRNEMVRSMFPGQRIYLDTTLKAYRRDQKLIQTTASNVGVKVNAILITGVLSNPIGETRHILCIERV